MKCIVSLIFAGLFIAGCQNAAPVNVMKGKWKLVGVAPTDTMSNDSSSNIGIAILALSMAIEKADTFRFNDSTYTVKDTKGGYRLNGNTVYIQNEGNTDTFTVTMNSDTLEMRSIERYVMHFKKIK
jgi:hypothetical protein